MVPLIIFENENLVIVDKASGVLSTPARFQEQDQRPCLGTVLQDQLKIQIFPVNRLDYEVSGLVIYAKNANAHRISNQWFEQKQITKAYRALSNGPNFDHLPPEVHRRSAELVQGIVSEWKCRLLRGKKRAYENQHGKESVTLARFVGRGEKYYQWDLNPVTGRSHQLRYEMSRHGQSIVGDVLYGSSENWSENSIALRAYKIDLSKADKATDLGLPKEIVIDTQL